MKTYEQLVQEYRKRQHDTVVDTIATGLTYVDEIAVDTGLLEETGLLTELTESDGRRSGCDRTDRLLGSHPGDHGRPGTV